MKDRKKILITGATGLIGQRLIPLLLSRSYEVAVLSRRQQPKTENHNISYYHWDVEKKYMDAEAIRSCDYIIHLAGENIGTKRWTKKRKQEIRDSRIQSTQLLYEYVRKYNPQLKAMIVTSAVGYYGARETEELFTEESPSCDDFLATTCRLLEHTSDLFRQMHIRTVQLRLGVVLDRDGGALSAMRKPLRIGVCAYMGNGKQYMPWVHVDDVCASYLRAVEDEHISGAYNIVAPVHTTHQTFLHSLSQVVSPRPFIRIHIPVGVLHIMLGEMASVLVYGGKISAQRWLQTGFVFLYPTLEKALSDLIRKS